MLDLIWVWLIVTNPRFIELIIKKRNNCIQRKLNTSSFRLIAKILDQCVIRVGITMGRCATEPRVDVGFLKINMGQNRLQVYFLFYMSLNLILTFNML